MTRKLVDYTSNYFSSPALATLKAAVANIGSVPMWVPIIGSSTTEGGNALTREKRYLSRLEKEYQLRFAPNGRGGIWVRASDWGTTGTTSIVSKGLGNRSRSLAQDATTSFTYGPASGYTISFAEGNNAQPFTVQIDALTPVTVTPATSGATRYTGKVYVDALTRARHTIKITADNPCIINGAYIHDGDATAGIHFINGGLGGTFANSFTDASIYEQIGAFQAPMVGIMIGSNDYNADVVPATYKSNVAGMIDLIDSVTTASIVLIHSYRRFDTSDPAYPWADYGSKLAELAAERYNVFYLDISAEYPANQGVDSLNLIDTDGIHQTDTGHEYMELLLANGVK